MVLIDECVSKKVYYKIKEFMDEDRIIYVPQSEFRGSSDDDLIIYAKEHDLYILSQDRGLCRKYEKSIYIGKHLKSKHLQILEGV